MMIKFTPLFQKLTLMVKPGNYYYRLATSEEIKEFLEEYRENYPESYNYNLEKLNEFNISTS